MDGRVQTTPRWLVALGMIAAILVATAVTSLVLRFAIAGHVVSPDFDLPSNLEDVVSAADAIVVGTVVSVEPLAGWSRGGSGGSVWLVPTPETLAGEPTGVASLSVCTIWVNEVYLDDRSYSSGLREGDLVDLLIRGDVSVDPTATPADPLVWYNRSALLGHTPHCEVGDHHLYFLTKEVDGEHYALWYGVYSRLSIDGPDVSLSTEPEVVIDIGEASETAAFLGELRRLIEPRTKEATEQAEVWARHNREWFKDRADRWVAGVNATFAAQQSESSKTPTSTQPEVPMPEPTSTPYDWKTITPAADENPVTPAPLPGGGKPTPNPAHTAIVVLGMTEEPGEVGPVPTMSPEARRQAYWCSSTRTARQTQPGWISSAVFSDGVWTIETEGQWEYYPTPHVTMAPVPHTTPTDESNQESWQDDRFFASCTMQFDAESGWLLRSILHVVTATPPSR